MGARGIDGPIGRGAIGGACINDSGSDEKEDEGADSINIDCESSGDAGGGIIYADKSAGWRNDRGVLCGSM